MTFRMAWPLWANLLVFLPLIALIVHGWLRSRKTRDTSQVTWARRGAIVLCLLALGLTPALRDPTEDVETTAEVYFVVDQTGSMGAEDYDGDQVRLDGVQSDMLDIVSMMPGARFSIIGFDSSAMRQMPLTSDTNAVRTWVDTATLELTNYGAGSTMDRPHDVMADTLLRAEENNPNHVRVVYFLSDGEDTDGDDSEPSTPGLYSDLSEVIDAGAVLGYGTSEGGPMRFNYGGQTGQGTYIQDPAGGDAISQIDEDNLRRLSSEMGLDYVHRSSPGGFEAMVDSIDVEQIAASDGREGVHTYRDIVWPFMIILGVLLAWEMYNLSRQLRTIGSERWTNRKVPKTQPTQRTAPRLTADPQPSRVVPRRRP